MKTETKTIEYLGYDTISEAQKIGSIEISKNSENYKNSDDFKTGLASGFEIHKIVGVSGFVPVLKYKNIIGEIWSRPIIRNIQIVHINNVNGEFAKFETEDGEKYLTGYTIINNTRKRM